MLLVTLVPTPIYLSPLIPCSYNIRYNIYHKTYIQTSKISILLVTLYKLLKLADVLPDITRADSLLSTTVEKLF